MEISRTSKLKDIWNRADASRLMILRYTCHTVPLRFFSSIRSLDRRLFPSPESLGCNATNVQECQARLQHLSGSRENMAWEGDVL